MNMVLTKHGNLKGVISPEFYANNFLKECMLDKYNEIKTNYGNLIPSYENEEVRKKYNRAISFYETGDIKSLSLQEQKLINTKIGDIPAELITFYPNGNINRIFPLNGKISGYWTEEDEYNLAEEIKLKLPTGIFKAKFVSVALYEDQEVKSITLWPKDTVNVVLPIGSIEARIGVSFYKDGKIKSLEPSSPKLIDTPIGGIMAYDTTAMGISGDSNSLNFLDDGTIKSLVSATDEIEITDKEGNKTTVKYTLKQNLFNLDVMDRVPLKIEFLGDKVRFNNDVNSEYAIEGNTFTINHKPLSVGKCGSCGDCSACG